MVWCIKIQPGAFLSGRKTLHFPPFLMESEKSDSIFLRVRTDRTKIFTDHSRKETYFKGTSKQIILINKALAAKKTIKHRIKSQTKYLHKPTSLTFGYITYFYKTILITSKVIN